MTQIMSFISPIIGYIEVSGIFILSFLILFSLIFNDNRRSARSLAKYVFILILTINIILYFVFYRLGNVLLRFSTPDFDVLAFTYMVFLTFIINHSFVFDLRDSAIRPKKGEGSEEVLSDVAKKGTSFKLDIAIIFIIFIFSAYFFGNGSLNELLVISLASTLICLFTSSIIFPLILKTSSKLVD